MKNFTLFIGIDISKLTLDVIGINEKNEFILHSEQFQNESATIKHFFNQLIKKYDKEHLLVGFENTGIYGRRLIKILEELAIPFCQLPSLEIQRSKGIQRGKSDRIDAKMIAQYLLTHRFKLKESIADDPHIEELQLLQNQRDKIIKAINQFSMHKELAPFVDKTIRKEVDQASENILHNLKKNLKKIEARIDEVIKENERVTQQMNLIQSVPGVGKVTALYLLTVTHGFRNFKDARKLACYAGVAPFPYQSGTSLNRKSRVSHFADKKLKSLLNMCALNAKRHDQEMKAYYERKVDEGKSKMLVINNVRNKLLARIFAVVKREQPFVNTQKYAA